MNQSEILSVNPCRTTLGDLHPEACLRRFRSNVLKYDMRKLRIRKRVQSVFGVGAPSGASRNATLMVMRLAFGALMFYSGFISFPTDIMTGCLEMAAGAVIALGLFTRILCGVAMVGFAALASMVAMTGVFDQSAVMYALVCGMFMLCGPGIVSIDGLFSRMMIRRARRRVARRVLSHDSYLS